MKKISKITALSLLMLFSGLLFGQKTALDSVCVQVEGKAVLNLAIYNYQNLSENIKDDFKNLQQILTETNDIPENKSYLINYEPNKSLTIKQTEVDEKIIWVNGEKSKYKLNNQCNIKADNYYLKIQFNEINALISDSLIAQLITVIDTTKNAQKRYSNTYNYTFEGMDLTHNKQFDVTNGQMDMLMLRGGVGVNLIKSEFVIDVAAEMAFVFNKKGIYKNQYFTSYNLLFDFMGESNVNLNGFLNLGYRYNFSKNIKKPNWLGVEMGYLVNSQGELFGKNTFKFGLDWELGKNISVSPQLYFSDNFSEIYPAIRIGFGF